MSPRLCGLLVGGPWVFSGFISLTHILLMARLVFCGNTELPHYFCDLTPLLRLSCTDTSVNKIFVLIVIGMVIATPFICILAAYVQIIVAIMKLPSAEGRRKTFPICSSHLSVVALLYMTTTGVCVLHMSAQP